MAGKIEHIGITVLTARTCLSVLQWYEQQEGQLSDEEFVAYKEISGKLASIKKQKAKKEGRKVHVIMKNE